MPPSQEMEAENLPYLSALDVTGHQQDSPFALEAHCIPQARASVVPGTHYAVTPISTNATSPALLSLASVDSYFLPFLLRSFVHYWFCLHR